SLVGRGLMTQADQLLALLAVLRRQWQRRIALEALAWVALAALIGLVAGWVVTWIVEPAGSALVAIRVLVYGLIVGTLVRFLVVPLARRTSDQRFALYVEEHAPELRQALIASVHELSAPETERSSPALTARLVGRTVEAVRPLERDGRIEKPRVVRALWLFGGAVAAAALVMMVRVVPGNAAVPKGASVDVGASLSGFASDSAELLFRTDSGQQWTHLPMSREKDKARFTSRLFDVAKATEYFVLANGIRSPTYKLTVSNLPAVSKLGLDVKYPAYTGMPTEHQDDGGDVAAVVGSTVTVRPATTMPVRSGSL